MALYQHFKGKIYTYIGEAIHTENLENLVIYKNSDGKLFARPVEMFFGHVNQDGYCGTRFRPIRRFGLRWILSFFNR